ncbi:hypothetical protein Lalb_Chr09g0333271 [Lupinus albus]|uniref:Uncharacterized protein n=1 Tax=Lupinus albus TaxID=3870 RepID=A0A6A4Q1Z6_LUPAL|nr:hypothetical protein Lalb_Chr09g0333271 [Lupinus albus]
MRHRDRFVVRIRLLHSLFLLFPHLRLFIQSTHSIPNSFRSLHKEMGMLPKLTFLSPFLLGSSREDKGRELPKFIPSSSSFSGNGDNK